MGPALIKHVVVTVDGQPMARWHDVLEKLLGPGVHHFSESDVGSLALSPNETVTMLTPYDDKGEPLHPGPPGSPGAMLDSGRDCWMLRASGRGPDTTNEVRGCPKPSERTFRE